MKIEHTQVKNPAFNGERCYVHARGYVAPDGFGIMTMQKLELTGCDVFYGLEMTKTYDFGKTFSPVTECKKLKRQYYADGTSVAICDATPSYHKATGKIILVGQTARYGADNSLMKDPRPRSTAYAVYDEETGDFGDFKLLDMPNDEVYFSAGAGSGQILETECGELLVPFYYQTVEEAQDSWGSCFSVAVARCSFDGSEMKIIEIGNAISIDVPRGLCEPSIVKFGDKYLFTLRNDLDGYVTSSEDGIHLGEAKPLCFDNGESVGNYCTQMHWLTGGGKLWLVYTRRGANNDHVFRHRAPLFIAEFDAERMCVIRETETVAVPERGEIPSDRSQLSAE